MLYSDIEQSTRLLTRLGPAYADALAEHRLELRAAWAAHAGVEMSTEGDSFFVVFPTAEDAVAAATAAQRALVRHAWPEGQVVRVRMGVHTGEPAVRDGDYVGMDVHRVARIAGAAHGGQVVISDATANLVDSRLPSGVRLRDLGGHRLKDLPSMEHLYQLVIADLPADFPPLVSLGVVSGLPVTTTSLIGRDRELTELAALVVAAEVRLVTLTGPGGSGKTRLAIAVPPLVADAFSGGLFFVPLAAATTAAVMWAGIAEVLDLPPRERTRAGVLGHLSQRLVLLVLDNLEQIDGADRAVATLLQEAPKATVLTTSRHPMNLTGEHQHAVPPLELPTGTSLEDVRASGAAQLFVQRARAVRASFDVTVDNAADVAAVCRHLDGLPLAIELAAARTKLLTPRALLSRLDQALDLSGPVTDRPTRQRTLRDTIAWSYQLLNAEQQALFRRLGVFAGGADLAAVSAITTGTDPGETDPIDIVTELVDASLAGVTDNFDGEPRVVLLETVRTYALDRLTAAGEAEDARRRHATYFADLAAASLSRDLETSGHDPLLNALLQFKLELDNFRAALAWATTAPPDPVRTAAPDPVTIGLALCAHLNWIWSEAASMDEISGWLNVVIQLAGERETGDLAGCLSAWAWDLDIQGDSERARLVAARAVKILRTRRDQQLSFALSVLGYVDCDLGEWQAARRAVEEGARVAREEGDVRGLGRALMTLSVLELTEERWDPALAASQEATRLFSEMGAEKMAAAMGQNTAVALRKLGRVTEALEVMSRTVRQLLPYGTQVSNAFLAEDYGAVLAEAGHVESAALLLGTADAARERYGTRRPQSQQAEIEDAYTTAEAAVNPAQWQAAYHRGRTMTVEDALSEAVSSTEDPGLFAGLDPSREGG